MNASDFYDFPFHPKVLDYGQFLAYCRLADRQTQCFIERCGDQSADRVFSPSNFLCTFKRQHFLRARSCLEDSEPISFLRCDQKCHPPKEGTENAAKEREREKGAEMGKVYSGDEMDGYERELGRVCAFQHCYSQCQEQIATQICPPGPAALAAELVRTYVQWHSADLLDWHILTGNELRLPQSCAKLAKSMTTAKGPDPVLKAMLVASSPPQQALSPTVNVGWPPYALPPYPSSPSLMCLLFLFLSPFISLPLLVPFSLALPSPQKRCPSPLFRQSRSSPPPNGTSPHYSTPIHFFAITQDCQFVLARPDQLGQLPSLSVSSSVSDCAPSRINLLWSLNSPVPSLLLLQQRAHKLCLLPIEVPFSVIAHSTELFRYSLRNALRHFALCHSSNSSSLLTLNPNLAFADSLYSDILYFLDPFSSSSADSLWTVHQFHLNSAGRLRPRNTFGSVKPMLQNISRRKSFLRDASPFLLASDPQRKRLFAVPRAQNDLEAEPIRWTCPFDLIFRPHLAHLRPLSLFSRLNSLLSPDSQLDGFAVDRNVAIFTESVRNSRDTFVFVAKFRPKRGAKSSLLAESHCVLKLSYGAKFGVISDQTLKELRDKGPLPSIGWDEEKTNPSEMPKSAENVPATQDDQSAEISLEKTTNGPRGHVIALPTAPLKATTKKVVDRIEPFWKAEAKTEMTTLKMPTTAEEKKMRLEENDGEEEGEEADGEWSNDYEQWRDQTAPEGRHGDGVAVPLREDGMGPALFLAKMSPSAGDKSAKAMGQMNGAGREARGTTTALLSSSVLLALTILF
ncbi:hypothetical protein niasHT_011378 [Heterodera trifolii]|uniref:Uncharacterized protein n=1 Tax=Heterodera trifolii TaxID=157864 RepID=A0ABD2LJ67_9BILA